MDKLLACARYRLFICGYTKHFSRDASFFSGNKYTCVTGSSGGKFAVKRNHRYVRNFKGGDHDKNRDVCLTIKKKQSVGLLGNSRVKHALHAAIPLKNKT